MSTVTHPLDLFRLDDTVVVVTGASAGLGERMARVMHAVAQPLSFQLGAESALKRLLTSLVETGQHRSQPIWRMKTIANDSSRND